MAALRLTFILVCVALFYTCAQGYSVPQAQSLGDPASDVQKLLEKLQKVVSREIDTALENISESTDKLEQAAKAVVTKAKDTLEAATKPFLEAIKKLKNKAADAAVDISECIGTSEDDIMNLPGTLLKNVSSCVDDEVAGAKKVVNDTITDSIKSAFDVIGDLGEAVKKCSKKPIPQQVTCYAEATDNITADLDSIPVKIILDEIKMMDYLENLIPSLGNCSAGVAGALGIDAAKIVADVTTCSMEKINNGTHFEDLELFA